jgi:general secretion pathway protein L
MADGELTCGENAMTKNSGSYGRIRQFYSWWLRELASVITKRPAKERPWRTMLFQGPDGLQIFSKGDGPITCLATLKKNAGPNEVADVRRILIGKALQDPKQTMLRLAPTEVVQRTIRVPTAAADLMNSIVENKIETIVDWSQENTYYGYRIADSDPALGDQIDTEIVATTKQLVDSALARARDIGLTPRAVDFAPSPEAASVVELLRLEPDPVSRTASRLFIAFSAILACSLAISVFGVYRLWDLQTQYEELNSKVAAVMTRVDEVKQLNEENTKIKDQRERLAKRKVDNPPAMELIEALSRALPDTAYLDEFEIHDNEARIVGKSSDPTGLIGTLESTPEFEDVRFAAPTTREDGEKLGTFSIIGKIQNEGTPEKRQ